MGKELLVHNNTTKLYLFTELFIIYLNLLLMLIILVILISANKIYQNNVNKTFLYRANNRIIRQDFMTNLSLTHISQTFITDSPCQSNFEYHPFMSLKSIKNVNYTDVTNNIKIIDSELFIKSNGNITQLANPDLSGYKYYTFDISDIGENSIDFLNSQDLWVWNDYIFCTQKIKMDFDYSSIKLINKNYQCKDVKEDSEVVDCGVFSDYYKMCILKNRVQFNKRPSSNDESLLTDIDFCPLSDIDVKVIKNPKYNKTDPNSLEYLGIFSFIKNNTLYSYRLNQKTKKTEFLGINIVDEYGYNKNLLENINSPKTQLIDVENNISFDNFYDLQNDTNLNLQDFEYSDSENLKVINLGQKVGLRDSLTKVIDSMDFYRFYNQTYFLNAVKINKSNDKVNKTEISYLPMGMRGLDSSSFYLPLKNSGKSNQPNLNIKDNVNIAFYKYKTFSSECFSNVFEKNNRNDFLKYLYEVSLEFLEEINTTLIAWSLCAICLYLWCFIKVRASVILDILNFRVVDSDKSSEKITKFTFKFLLFVVFSILLKGIYLEQNFGEKIRVNSSYLKLNKCFGASLTKNFQFVIDTMDLIDGKYSLVRSLFLGVLSTEIFLLIIYIINLKNEYTPINKMNEERNIDD